MNEIVIFYAFTIYIYLFFKKKKKKDEDTIHVLNSYRLSWKYSAVIYRSKLVEVRKKCDRTGSQSKQTELTNDPEATTVFRWSRHNLSKGSDTITPGWVTYGLHS